MHSSGLRIVAKAEHQRDSKSPSTYVQALEENFIQRASHPEKHAAGFNLALPVIVGQGQPSAHH